MIPNITRGSRMSGLMLYLASTDTDKTKNAHTDPHLVAGDAAIMAWYDDGVLDRDDAVAIANHLDQPRKAFGVEVLQKDFRWDPAKKERVPNGHKHADVWHCSLSLRAEEGALTDQQWGDIANDFVDTMGFTEASGKAQCRWVAINHGTSENGNHHIHIAVSLVREDGTKASTHGDYKRAQQTCRELETKYGLEELSSVHATRGYDRAEKATAVRDEREMHRASLARKVRACASASATEAEFVRRARDTGILVRPRYAKNTTDVIVGYSVAERPKPGERPIWFGGGTLASDLKLGALREDWMDSPHLATEAAAEWNAAARNKRKVSRTGPENATPSADVWVEYTRNATALADQLRIIPRDDHATWAKAAREVSGAFAAWSCRLEATPGPLAATAAELSRTAQLRAPRQHGKPVTLPSIAGTAMLFMAASSKDKTAAQTALMVQLINTAFAVYEMHAQSGRTREAQRIRSVVENQLAPFTATMPKAVLVGAERQPAEAAAVPPRAVDIARRGMAPIRPGSVVPTTPTPGTPAKTYQPSRNTGPGLDR
ncbi:relaxase/mobilization nuclease domain-containing protein [Pseudarthrobacter oxydans]|uniref:relaxase/mobilization nuclease domain-containing protein n=1 Tax=Pseudarthrobacter oxydans TaxID=1671 RepID=UPI0015720D2A|nr:relaxase/mobilization nuclease domain-containing protein [Pseudarthrobacter oxydans]MBD1540590.1 relaxase/mobilization nuclease domain-containing protein [Arthrobacter sp. S13_S34]NSX38407.1 relaxase/mobilization nuclease domain-containing protein [Pseudarthrobacter oxydans]